MFRQKSENQRNFAAVCKSLKNHRLRLHHTLRFTLNRLFQKNLAQIYPADQLPVLSAENTVISKESRPKLDWAKLANLQKSASHEGDGPIVVFRFGGMERLLDGNHRCRHWLKTQDNGAHTAIVLTVMDQPAGKARVPPAGAR